MAQVLPRELRLVAPATMPQARSYLFKQQSTLSEYTEGQTIQINIPRLQRSYLTKDSYLKFLIKAPYTPTWRTGKATGVTDHEYYYESAVPIFDTPGAQGLISKIEVYDYLGSTLLESISSYDALVATLQDIHVNGDQKGFHHNVTDGTHGPLLQLDFQQLYNATTPTTLNACFYTSSVQRGDRLGDITIADATTAPASEEVTVYREVAFPLLSFLGDLSNKFVPLHNGFTISITLNTFSKAFGFADVDDGGAVANTSFDTSAVKIQEVNMCCQVLELGPVAESMLLSSTGGQPLVVPAKSFRNFMNTITAGSASHKIDLNLNVASLTNVLFIMRQTSNLTTTPILKKSLSSRCRNYLSSWYFQYGSSILPQTSGISCRGRLGQDIAIKSRASTEAYVELLKSRHRLNVPTHGGCIDLNSFSIDIPTTNGNLLYANGVDTRGMFAAGLDLELVSGRSQEIVSGLNTNGMNTSIQLTFDTTIETGETTANSPEQAQLDVWCEYDSFINVSPGIATTVSF